MCAEAASREGRAAGEALGEIRALDATLCCLQETHLRSKDTDGGKTDDGAIKNQKASVGDDG